MPTLIGYGFRGIQLWGSGQPGMWVSYGSFQGVALQIIWILTSLKLPDLCAMIFQESIRVN